MQPSDIATADEEWLIDLCHQAKEERGMIGGGLHGNKVVKISDQIAVKYGVVQASEAATQDFAFNHVDRNLVHIPKVYRYIVSHRSPHPTGYLFMEYVQGQNLTDVDLDIHQDIPSRVAKILAHLAQITGPAPIPGPIGSGEPQGYIYGDDGSMTTFASIADLNAYMNKRLDRRNEFLNKRLLLDCNDSIDLTPYPLVLCHGDICRRNMILESDGSLCLVDWGFAGLYPRFFELASISCVLPYDAAFEKPLTSEFEKLLGLTDQEKHDMQLTLFVRGANLRWSFDESRSTIATEGFFQEFFGKREGHRNKGESDEISDFNTSNLHSGSLVSEIESHTTGPHPLSGKDTGEVQK